MAEKKVNANASCFVDDYNALIFIIESVVNKINTIDLVKVEKVNGDNTIDVIPIIRGANTNGEAIEQSTIYGIRYLRWQYGKNALKAIPEVGDIGLIAVCKKDISNVENGLVGSYRKFCPADGIYLGGIMGLNADPEQYIEFGSGGINITSPTNLTVNATNATINATEINLGGSGGKKIALDGDSVVAGTTVIGTIQASSATTKSL